jgi:hypothetical protein
VKLSLPELREIERSYLVRYYEFTDKRNPAPSPPHTWSVTFELVTKVSQRRPEVPALLF